MADPEDLAKGIAENIGYMPMVNKAGEMGGNLLDFLGSLIGGGKSTPAPAKAQPQAAQQPDFLSGLWKAITSGAQGTADAFGQDVDDVKQGRLPRQGMRAGGQVLGAMGSPSVNPVVGGQKVYQHIFDPDKGWISVLDEAQSYPGGDWLSLFSRQGGFGQLISELLKQSEKAKGQ